MKKSHRKRKIIAALLSLTLCCSLVLGGPAASAQETPVSQDPLLTQELDGLEDLVPQDDLQQSVEDTQQDQGVEDPNQQEDSDGTPKDGPDEGTLPDEDASEGQGQVDPENPEGEGSQEETPDEDEDGIFTVTYNMGVHGSVTEEVADGELPQQVPDIPELPGATALGWFDGDGQQVNPAEVPGRGT